MKKIIILIILAGIIIFLGYKYSHRIFYLGYECYSSITISQKSQKFLEIKGQRYERIIQRLKDIRTAQDAYKGINGTYTGSFDTLIHFIQYDSVKIARTIGSLSDEDLEKGITESQAIKEGKLTRDTIKVSALENVFGKDFPIQDLRYVPYTQRQHQFKMGASSIFTDSRVEVPVFEARISNMEIFEDIRGKYNEQLQEENEERIRQNKYPGLKVGDLKEANNNAGNWE